MLLKVEMTNGERGMGNWEMGNEKWERWTGNGERGTENRELRTGNGEPGTGVWERVYSSNPHEKSNWLTKPSKEGEFYCDMKAKFFRKAPLFVVIGLLAFI